MYVGVVHVGRRLPKLEIGADGERLAGHDVADRRHRPEAAFPTRARLTAANGNAENQVELVDTRAGWFEWTRYFWYPIGTSVPVMDRWLDNFAADRGKGTRAAKVVRNKPKDLEEGCTGVDGEQIAERAAYDGPGRCDRMYPSYSSTRASARWSRRSPGNGSSGLPYSSYTPMTMISYGSRPESPLGSTAALAARRATSA